jgi:hypothetical protein
MNRILSFSAILISLFILNGCLTSEFKEYKLKINPDKSGTGSFKFINILSHNYSEEDSIDIDFIELVNDYVDGNKLEEKMPGVKIVTKKLFEENGRLSGLVEFEFKNIKDLGFHQYDENSPIMYYIDIWSENYVNSNGEFNPDIMPVVFWNKDTEEIRLKTTISGEVDTEDPSYVSLLDNYKKWVAGSN